MINESTLNTLNKIGFGADISKLESYVFDFKQSQRVCNMRLYEYTSNKLYDILKEIKPESEVFKEESAQGYVDDNNYDKLLSTYPCYINDIAFGSKSSNLELLKEVIDANGTTLDMIGIVNVNGIPVQCIYINGFIYRVYVVVESHKIMDITQLTKFLLPKYIAELQQYEICDIRGVLTVLNDKKKLQSMYNNVESIVMHCLRNKVYMDELSFIFNNIYSNKQIDDCDEQWDKLQFLRECNLAVPHHGLLRNIDRDLLGDALISFDEYFDNIFSKQKPMYKYSGIIIKTNKLLDDNPNSSIVYNSVDCNPKQLYTSEIIDVRTNNLVDDNKIFIELDIKPVNCNNSLEISSIFVDDIMNIVDNDLYIGKKVSFIVVNGKAVQINV